MWSAFRSVLVLGLIASCGGATVGGVVRSSSTPAGESELAAGSHWRLETSRGVVHVWRPKGFQPQAAGTVVYVHGYYVHADEAWQDHHLADQFSESRRNAVFIVPEAPAGDAEEVSWEKLEELLTVVWNETKIRPPRGPLVTIGHSGAFRTLACWLDHPGLERVILLDGFYSHEDRFATWLQEGNAAGKQLILVGSHTAAKIQEFIQRFPFAVSREGFPDGYNPPFTEHEKSARLLYVLSQYEHMGLVTDGLVLPAVLELVPLPAVPQGRTKFPWES